MTVSVGEAKRLSDIAVAVSTQGRVDLPERKNNMGTEAMKQLVAQAREDPAFFHALIFNPETVLAKLDYLSRAAKASLVAIRPEQIISILTGRNVSCDGNVTCSCTTGTCGGETCGGSTCGGGPTCSGDSCGSTCGNSCTWTTDFSGFGRDFRTGLPGRFSGTRFP